MSAANKTNKCSVKYCRNQRHQHRSICAKHAMREWRLNNPVTSLLNIIRGRAKRKGISFSITLADFKAFCLSQGFQRGTHHVDRIDPARGYHMDNIQLLGGAENIAKGNRERHSERYKAYLASRKNMEMDCPF